MANPQPEDGHTRIANELMEAFAKLKLPNYEFRVLLAILRETYGWNKKIREISITRIQKITGIKRRHVHRAIGGLKDKKIVTSTGNSFVAAYGIQKDYTNWKSLPLQVPETIVTSTGPKRTSTGNDLVTATGPQNPEDARQAKLSESQKQKAIFKTKAADIFSLKKRYHDQQLIDDAFKAIASTRKSGKVADSIILAQLQKWERYPVEQVEAGIRTYVDKDYGSDGKGENYLLGIIRNSNSPPKNSRGGQNRNSGPPEPVYEPWKRGNF